MRRRRMQLWSALLAPVLLGIFAPASHAEKIYRLTELGYSGHERFTHDSAGNRLVLNAGGTVGYAFPETANLPINAETLAARTPLPRYPEEFSGPLHHHYYS